jgi:hypothetical protein
MEILTDSTQFFIINFKGFHFELEIERQKIQLLGSRLGLQGIVNQHHGCQMQAESFESPLLFALTKCRDGFGSQLGLICVDSP